MLTRSVHETDADVALCAERYTHLDPSAVRTCSPPPSNAGCPS